MELFVFRLLTFAGMRNSKLKIREVCFEFSRNENKVTDGAVVELVLTNFQVTVS